MPCSLFYLYIHLLLYFNSGYVFHCYFFVYVLLLDEQCIIKDKYVMFFASVMIVTKNIGQWAFSLTFFFLL